MQLGTEQNKAIKRLKINKTFCFAVHAIRHRFRVASTHEESSLSSSAEVMHTSFKSLKVNHLLASMSMKVTES